MANDQIRRTPFFSALRDRPRLPVDLLKITPICPDGQHDGSGNCCYFEALRVGQYSEALCLKEVDNLQRLQERMTPPKVTKPVVDVSDQQEEGAVASWLRRKVRRDDPQRHLINEDLEAERVASHKEEEPDGMYLVVGGERIKIDG